MSKKHNRNLDHCLKCTICHTQCPVVASFPDFPGPKQLGPELERLRLARGKDELLEVDNVLTYCMSCKRCDMACPHGVNPAYYNRKNRQKLKLKSSEKFRNWILAHNVWWGKIASRIPGFSNFALQFPLARIGMGIVGLANRNLPDYKKLNIKIKKEEKSKKVLYFAGCFASFNDPKIIQSCINILEACNYQVEFAPVECCGMPVMSNAFQEEARSFAEKNRKIFLDYIDKGYKIVTTCTSCELMLKEEYEELLEDENIKKLSGNVWGLFELLEEEENIPFDKNKKQIEKAYYHIPCHLKAQGTGNPAVKFLREYGVKELMVVDDYCCGIAGSYGFKKEKHKLSMEIGSSLFNAVKSFGAELVITDCGTCKVQIKDGTGVEVKHPAVVMNDYL